MTLDFNLAGKVAIVTGGGSGIGQAVALSLARAGADVVVAARRVELIEGTAAEVRAVGRKALAVPTDVTSSAQVNRLVAQTLERFGQIDILVNNAGIVRGQPVKPLWEISDAEWHLGLDTNLTGTFFCCRAVAQHMVERRQGKIINMASGFGLRGQRDNFMYCSAKAGVILFTKSLALSVAPYGVNVNAIAPGVIGSEHILEDSPLRNAARFIPAGRLGEPGEVGQLAVFLASAAAGYITGEVFVIDGAGLAGGYAPTGYAPVIPFPADERWLR